MDSLTRVAHARREIGLALGEQPTSKGYPLSVVLIPTLIERSGTGLAGQGSITSFYTVLADGDDTNDPVVDTARAIFDGHILLAPANPAWYLSSGGCACLCQPRDERNCQPATNRCRGCISQADFHVSGKPGSDFNGRLCGWPDPTRIYGSIMAKPD